MPHPHTVIVTLTTMIRYNEAIRVTATSSAYVLKKVLEPLRDRFVCSEVQIFLRINVTKLVCTYTLRGTRDNLA
jgi:hypothetical protein